MVDSVVGVRHSRMLLAMVRLGSPQANSGLDPRLKLSGVKVPVSLDQEIGAICLRNLRAGGPGLLFERPGDRAMPLAVDLLASRRRYALALGIEADQLATEWNRRTSNPLPPVIVERGACQENVLMGKEIDLFKLPVPIWNE